MNKVQKNTGFTLVELLIVVTIVSIVVGIAVPNFNALATSNAITSKTNYFTSAVQLARNEAIKRNVTVSMCVRAGLDCSNSTNWQDGWVVFADADGDQRVDAGEEIRVFDPLGNGFTLNPSETISSLAFNAEGMAVSVTGNFAGVDFSMCDGSGDIEKARNISMNVAGRVRLAQGVDSCS